jgi:hypothetical protein
MLLETALLGFALFVAYKIGRASVGALYFGRLYIAGVRIKELEDEAKQLAFACRLFESSCKEKEQKILTCKTTLGRLRTMVLAYRVPQAHAIVTEIGKAEHAIIHHKDDSHGKNP